MDRLRAIQLEAAPPAMAQREKCFIREVKNRAFSAKPRSSSAGIKNSTLFTTLSSEIQTKLLNSLDLRSKKQISEYYASFNEFPSLSAFLSFYKFSYKKHLQELSRDSHKIEHQKNLNFLSQNPLGGKSSEEFLSKLSFAQSKKLCLTIEAKKTLVGRRTEGMGLSRIHNKSNFSRKFFQAEKVIEETRRNADKRGSKKSLLKQLIADNNLAIEGARENIRRSSKIIFLEKLESEQLIKLVQ